MKTYEAVFVLDERQFDDQGEAFSREVEKRITVLGGRLRDRIAMGRKQFARPVKKLNAGVYWDFVFDLEPENVKPLKETYRLNDSVIRSEVFIFDAPEKPEVQA
ncbi:MAG: 30S ribosomal protein S6 [Lentisphaeria bacterium]